MLNLPYIKCHLETMTSSIFSIKLDKENDIP